MILPGFRVFYSSERLAILHGDSKKCLLLPCKITSFSDEGNMVFFSLGQKLEITDTQDQKHYLPAFAGGKDNSSKISVSGQLSFTTQFDVVPAKWCPIEYPGLWMWTLD